MHPQQLQKLREGDPQAWQQLERQERPALESYLRREAFRHLRAEVGDIVQETWLVAARTRLSGFKPGPRRALRSYLRGIAHHKLIDRGRVYQRRREGGVVSSESIAATSPEECQESLEGDVMALYQPLSRAQLVYVLRQELKLPVKQIQARLGPTATPRYWEEVAAKQVRPKLRTASVLREIAQLDPQVLAELRRRRRMLCYAFYARRELSEPALDVIWRTVQHVFWLGERASTIGRRLRRVFDALFTVSLPYWHPQAPRERIGDARLPSCEDSDLHARSGRLISRFFQICSELRGTHRVDGQLAKLMALITRQGQELRYHLLAAAVALFKSSVTGPGVDGMGAAQGCCVCWLATDGSDVWQKGQPPSLSWSW